MCPSESTYSNGWARCADPSLWTAPDADACEDEVADLLAAVVRAVKPQVAVETGTYRGFTAERIGRALQANGRGHLWTVEIDIRRVRESVERCVGLPVTVVNVDSLQWTPPDGIGFAWFDSALEAREMEFEMYRERMRPGCIVGFHDTSPRFRPNVGQQVENLASRGLLRPVALPTPRGCYLAEVL